MFRFTESEHSERFLVQCTPGHQKPILKDVQSDHVGIAKIGVRRSPMRSRLMLLVGIYAHTVFLGCSPLLRQGNPPSASNLTEPTMGIWLRNTLGRCPPRKGRTAKPNGQAQHSRPFNLSDEQSETGLGSHGITHGRIEILDRLARPIKIAIGSFNVRLGQFPQLEDQVAAAQPRLLVLLHDVRQS